jgi:hypothetical protein
MTVYNVTIKKSLRNIRVYTIKKSVKGNTNKISQIVESLIQKYLLKEKPGELNEGQV